MRVPSSLFRLLAPVLLLVAACAGPEATAPDDEQLTAVMPELAAEPGTAGTERYVPILHRVFGQAIHHLARAQGQEAAQRIAAEVRTRHEAVRDAIEAGDRELAQRKAAELDHFLASVAVRVFGPRVAAHVLEHAERGFDALAGKIRDAAQAGRDVARVHQGAQAAAHHLAAARTAASNGNPHGVLFHAAHAADLLAHLHAAL